MPRKRKRRLGHITMSEKLAVTAAQKDAEMGCRKIYGKVTWICVNGVRHFREQLKARGF